MRKAAAAQRHPRTTLVVDRGERCSLVEILREQALEAHHLCYMPIIKEN